MANSRKRMETGFKILLVLLFIPPNINLSTNSTRCVNPGGTGGCYASIQAAIDASNSGDTVSVEAGTYFEDIRMKPGVDVIGAGAGISIIHGVSASTTNPAAVVMFLDSNIGLDTLLEGFTITGKTDSTRGGGIYIHEGASPTVKNNLITGNSAVSGGGSGGGIAVFTGSTPVITGNTITGNHAVGGGGIYIRDASPTVLNNQITGNLAEGQGGGVVIFENAAPSLIGNIISNNASQCDGGGMVVQTNSASTEIIGNTIQDNQTTGSSPCGVGGGIKFFLNGAGNVEANNILGNIASASGGGMYIERSSIPTINRNRIIGNSATNYGGGLVVMTASQPTITNNYIAANDAGIAGTGIFVHDGTSPLIVNNTIAANTEGFGDGITIYGTTPAPTILNNLIVSNLYGIRVTSAVFNGLADYNDVWNNTTANYVNLNPGPHDISADPRFVDPNNHDYQLKSGSPAIDAGTNTFAPTKDIDGDSRPQDGDQDGAAEFDIGADEYLFKVIIWTDWVYLPTVIR